MTVDDFLDKELERLIKETGVTLPECDCYCGVPWMPKWFRVILSEKFDKSCKVHDIYYITHCIDNEDADQIFLEHMLLQAGDSKYWQCVAFFFYLQVRVYQFFKRDFTSKYKD